MNKVLRLQKGRKEDENGLMLSKCDLLASLYICWHYHVSLEQRKVRLV